MKTTFNTWQNFTIICGNHKDDHSNEMTLHEGPHSLFYSCPKYQSIYKHLPDKSCNNRLSLDDYERMITHLNIKSTTKTGIEDLCLQGYRFSDRGIDYEVLKHEDGQFVVSVLNKKAMARI